MLSSSVLAFREDREPLPRDIRRRNAGCHVAGAGDDSGNRGRLSISIWS